MKANAFLKAKLEDLDRVEIGEVLDRFKDEPRWGDTCPICGEQVTGKSDQGNYNCQCRSIILDVYKNALKEERNDKRLGQIKDFFSKEV